jgi:LPS O-antigen subunit length determinant protein (WzzB/FepE family)
VSSDADSNVLSSAQSEIDFRALFNAVWVSRVFVLSLTVFCGAVSVVYALSLQNVYQSKAVIAPKEASGGGISQLASQLGGLASIAGIDLGSKASNEAALSIERVRSFNFFKEHVYDEILVELAAANYWDQEANVLHLNKELYDEASEEWARGGGAKPTYQEAFKSFNQIFSVSYDIHSTLVTLRVSHISPFVAKRWLEIIIRQVNESKRARDIHEAEQSIAYLNNQRAENDLVELNEIFAQLIQEQTKTVMLANASSDYLFEVIEPPIAPEEKFAPSRAKICVTWTLFGAIIGVVMSLLRSFLRKEK